MLKHSVRCTSLDCMKETLSYLALQGWYEIDSANIFNLLSASDKRQISTSAHLLYLQHWQNDPFFSPGSQQEHHLRETHFHVVCKRMKVTLLTDAPVDLGMPNSGHLFRAQIAHGWGHRVSGLVLRLDNNVLIDSVFIKHENELLCYRQPFCCRTSDEHQGLDCKVDYMDTNQGIGPESDNICVEYMDSDLNNTF
jgi:hypothetical protein